MSDDHSTHYTIFGGWVAIAALIIAMMHYGYSCSCAGCDLVDSVGKYDDMGSK